VSTGGQEGLARWIEAVVGAAPVSVRPLPSSSSIVLAVEVPGRSLVVRRMTEERWRERDPDVIATEASILEALEPTPVPAPRLVGFDPDGTESGLPTLAVERLPGSGDVGGFGGEGGHRLLIAPLEAIHAAPVAARRYRPYTVPEEMWTPAWASDRVLWSDAIAAAAGEPPNGPEGFMHRDYHGGNVLVSDGRVTGVVDWIEASVGPQAVDAARAALNLAVAHGPSDAAAFLAACRRADVATDPFWTLVDALDSVDWYDGEEAVDSWEGPAGHARVVRAQLEEHLGSALRAL
jgi:aminoglycoside phosphotransferase (APT) family kinase protein